VAEEVRKLRKTESDRGRRGRPAKATTDQYEEERVRVIRLLLRKVGNWHRKGPHKESPRWKDIAAAAAASHPDLFRGDAKFPLTDSRVAQIADKSDINLDEIRGDLNLEASE
jgi:hypothetical protein